MSIDLHLCLFELYVKSSSSTVNCLEIPLTHVTWSASTCPPHSYLQDQTLKRYEFYLLSLSHLQDQILKRNEFYLLSLSHLQDQT